MMPIQRRRLYQPGRRVASEVLEGVEVMPTTLTGCGAGAHSC